MNMPMTMQEEMAKFQEIKEVLCLAEDMAKDKIRHISKHPEGDDDDIIDDDQIDSVRDGVEIIKMSVGTKLKYLHYSILRKEIEDEATEKMRMLREFESSPEGRAFMKARSCDCK